MNESMLFKIESIVGDLGKVSVRELKKMFPDSRRELSSAISVFIVRCNARTEHYGGTLFILSQSFTDKSEKKTTTERKETGDKIEILPKGLPINNDWIVTAIGCSSKLFFDGRYSRDDVRSSFYKSEGCKFHDTRAKRYHKVEPLKTAQNF